MDQTAAGGALRIAIVGAESTGKTSLAQALAQALAQHTGLRATWVPEWLRQWCDHTGRTPLPHEQASILRAQQERIEAAAAAHDIVVCDTTPLMTAVYSRLLFNDLSLQARALQLQQRVALTLLTALDLPWVPDGHQRDGPQVQRPVDDLLRALLIGHRLPWARVGGQGQARVQSALDAVAPLLRQVPAPGRGLFTRLHARNAGPAGRAWVCSCCDVPEAEQALQRLQAPG